MLLSKLRDKFLITCMSITLLVVFAAFSAVYLITQENIQSENQLKLSTAALFYRTQLTPFIYQEAGEDALVSLPAFTVIAGDIGVFIDIRTIVELTDVLKEEAVKTALKNPEKGGLVKIENKTWVYDVSPEYIFENEGSIANGGNKLIVFLDITESVNILRGLMLTFMTVGVIMIIIVFFVSLFLANHSIKPVKLAWERQRQFVADASHELKTPLAVMTSTYSALQANEDETIKSQSEFFGYMKSSMDKMAKLINDLLLLARMESASREIIPAPFDIGAELKKVMLNFETLIQEKSVTFSCSIEPNVMINSEKTLTIQVFEILFDNAVKYVNVGGTILVSLKYETHGVICTVGNSGVGIENDDIPKIFDRFYRADHSRSSETGGHGLGLAIAKTIMNKLGGKITVESKNRWTAFSIIFKECVVRP